MNFDEIPIRMMQLGVNRAWLAEQCDYSMSSIANMLATGGNPASKNDKSLRRIWEALDREEERQRGANLLPVGVPFRVLLEPEKEQFDRWMSAAYSVPGRTFDEWASAGLDDLANVELGITVEKTPSKKSSA